MMKEKGYDDDYSVAVTVSSACQGIIIPPSHNMVIYSLAAGGVSVGKMFLGGIIPGIMLGVFLMVISYFLAVKRGYPREERISLREAARITREAILGILTAVIIIGGVVSGVFTATESAAVACVYSFAITFFVYREIPLRRMGKILFNSLKTLAMVMSLIAAASAFGWLMARLRVPALATQALLSLNPDPVLLLILINILLLALGTIMDMAPLILIVTPILMPVVTGVLGMDPVHFGIVMMLNLGIGLCTPPVGSALFVGCSIGKISITKATKGLLPFYGFMIANLMLVSFVPQITMLIPNMMK